MSTKAEILEQAMALPEAERIDLADALMASVSGEAWLAELDSRVAKLDSGEDPGEAWEVVRDRLRRRYAQAG